VDGQPPNPDSLIATAALVPSSTCDFATAFCRSSSVENEDPVRPGDERFKKLSNGVKGPYNKVFATRQVIASTGAMPIVGHEAPCRYIGLSLPNRIPESHWQIGIL
jgi:hypothetical protein